MTIVPTFTNPEWNWGERIFPSGIGSDGTRDLVEGQFGVLAKNAQLLLTMMVGDGTGGLMGDLNTLIQSLPSQSVPYTEVTVPDLGFTVGDRPVISSYSSTLFTNLLAKLNNDILNGSTGLSAIVEQAIFDRASFRQDLIDDKAATETAQRLSTNGWDRPTGAHEVIMQENSNISVLARTELNENIAIEQAKLAQKNMSEVLTVARELEGILRDFASKTYAAEVQAYDVEAKAQGESAKIEAEGWKLRLENVKNKMDAATEEVRSAVQGYVSEYSLRERIVSSQLGITAQGYAATIGAANVSGSLGHDTHISESDSFNHTESRGRDNNQSETLTEHHSFTDV